MTRDPKRYTCVRCGAQDFENQLQYMYLQVPGESGSSRFCETCAVHLWDCPVHFVFHLGVPESIRSRLQSFAVLQDLRLWFGESKPFPVHVFHRRETETIRFHSWYELRRRKGLPPAPYSYRGFCSSTEIALYWDETETPDSLTWLLFHELGHHVCHSTQMFDTAMELENKAAGRDVYDWADDAAHEADSEERLVNRIATAHMDGREYARAWWRPRVTAFLAGLPMPDPHAK